MAPSQMRRRRNYVRCAARRPLGLAPRRSKAIWDMTGYGRPPAHMASLLADDEGTTARSTRPRFTARGSCRTTSNGFSVFFLSFFLGAYGSGWWGWRRHWLAQPASARRIRPPRRPSPRSLLYKTGARLPIGCPPESNPPSATRSGVVETPPSKYTFTDL